MCTVVPNRHKLESPTASHSEDDIFEDRHDSSTDNTRDGDCDKPGHKNVAKQSPVNSLLGSKPADRHNRAHLQEKSGQGN